MDIKSSTPVELMNLYAEILIELNQRKVVRTYNSPVGDYAEWLVSEKLGYILEHNSQKGLMHMIQKQVFGIKSKAAGNGVQSPYKAEN